jgi:hypothetical protein
VELCALQDWIKHHGLRGVVIFEGRDAAGKGGAIKAITDRVSPRVFRVVAVLIAAPVTGWRWLVVGGERPGLCAAPSTRAPVFVIALR